MRVAIIGAGNSGCAHAAKLVQNGHIVNLIKTSNAMHNENFDTIMQSKCIKCIDHTDNDNRFVAKLNLVTKDLEKGLEGVDVVMVLTQSLQHKTLAPKVGQYLKDGQIVFIIPGNLGSTQLAKYTNKDVIFVEGESTPFDARISALGVVNILFRNARNAVAFLRDEHRIYLDKINELFKAHKYLRTNIFESALHNPNLIVHTIGAIMSASRIETSNGEFSLYKEAFTPSIWNLIKDLDAEKMKVITACGGEQAISYIDSAKWRNEEDLSKDSLEVFKSYSEDAPKGPFEVNSRYIYEDVPMGLCLLENLGKIKNIETPIASSLISIASSLLSIDYRKQAYKIEEIKGFIAK